ncbi:apolipoprotein N-acyltransferase [Bdellovibrio sp. HCB209]|uniref:apolipoprotein N-acyltransferase n=1 Tax=Bdellovibrio sp. HCB209 TaxID=3394354 RepID=UPI0039B3AAFF
MMKKAAQLFKHKAYELRWALLSGILVGTSYIPFPPWALLFCYAPLWFSITEGNSPSVKKAFWSGWVTQFLLTAIGFHWIAYTAHVFGAMPWSVSIAALLLFCAFMHLYIPTAAAVGVWLQRRFQLSRIQTLFTIALLHALLERTWPVIFDWHLGYTLLGAHIPAYQWADVIGFAGLSALILIFNAWATTIWLKFKTSRQQAGLHLAAFIAVIVFLIAGGAYHKAPWDHFDQEFKTTVIQANIGNSDKIQAEQGRGAQEFITRKFTAMTMDAFAKYPDTDLFVWPETAFPDYLDQRLLGRKHTQMLAQGMATLDRPILTGAYSRSPVLDAHRDEATFNALFLIDGRGNNLDAPYLKTNLLAFGEYLPLSEKFPILLKWLPFISNFGRGKGPHAISWNHKGEPIRLGGQICYEGLDPQFSRGLIADKSDILVNVTNDSWFGQPSEPLQHMYMTLARGIETRRPLIRSTNTGISTVIWANGDLQQKSPLHQEWAGQFTVKYRKDAPVTAYVKWGHYDWIVLLLALTGIVLIGALHARSRRP